MTRFAFDLYPRDDPGAGTRLVRFTQLQSAEYRKDANGTGAGKLSLRASSTDAAFIDPAGLQYVRVVLIKNDASEVTYGGFLLDNGDFAALTETSTKLLNFGGAGSLSVLQRAIAAEASYIGADGPVDGEWRWSTQTVGEILDRMVREAQAAARPQDPLPMVTIDFDGDVDSAATPWPITDVDFRFPVGRDLLELTRQAMGLGLFVDMDGDFGLHAWVTRGTDRTGVAWGSGVIRFQAPSAATVATGNIKSEATRGLTAKVQRSDMLVGSPEVGYAWVSGSPTLGLQDIDWEGFFPTDSQMAGLAGPAIAEAQLAARDDAGDTVRLRTVFGESPTSGAYAPGLHYDVADTVTLHTGTGTWDWNETSQVVSNVTLKLRDGGDWDVWVDLGSSFQSMASRQFQVGSGGAGCVCLRLCTGITDTFNREDGGPGISDSGHTWVSFGDPPVVDEGRLAMIPLAVGLSTAELDVLALPLPAEVTFELEATGDLLTHGSGSTAILLDNARIGLRTDTNELLISYNAAFNVTSLSFTITPAVVYKVRMLLHTNNIRLKIWELADPEPTDWMVDHTDPVGFPDNHATTFAAHNAQTSDLYYLENLDIVGVGGCTEPVDGPTGNGAAATAARADHVHSADAEAVPYAGPAMGVTVAAALNELSFVGRMKWGTD